MEIDKSQVIEPLKSRGEDAKAVPVAVRVAVGVRSVVVPAALRLGVGRGGTDRSVAVGGSSASRAMGCPLVAGP
jgi:hypothetical protein